MNEQNQGIAKKPLRLRMNRRLSIILVCFLISTIFWLLIALSENYLTTVTLPVKYVNFPGKKVVMNDLPSRITVQLKTSGFRIMSWEFQGDRKPIEIDVASSLQNFQASAEVLSLPTQSFLQDFSRELGKEISISGFQPDSIVFNFSDLMTKKVPVQLLFKASYERQFDTTGPPVLTPALIEVSGPPSMVDSLDIVETEKVSLSNLKAAATGKVKLKGSKLLTYNVDEVSYMLPVEKFTEGTVDVEVNPVNVGTGFSIRTFPDHVKVRYLVALSNYNKIEASMFDAVVDATNLEHKQVPKLHVQLVTHPGMVRISGIEPEKVDYILRKK